MHFDDVVKHDTYRKMVFPLREIFPIFQNSLNAPGFCDVRDFVSFGRLGFLRSGILRFYNLGLSFLVIAKKCSAISIPKYITDFN